MADQDAASDTSAACGEDYETAIVPDVTRTDAIGLAWSDEVEPLAESSGRRQGLMVTVAALIVFAVAAGIFGYVSLGGHGSPPSVGRDRVDSPTPVTPARVDDDRYLSRIGNSGMGIVIRNREQAIAAAHVYCGALANGASLADVIQTIMRANDLGEFKSRFILGATIDVYCPQYVGVLQK
ncbi:hypothetical protein MMRN_38250 [Mycobacterium marinum]|uniref:DUF732 domain-containing protein n=1 Tax=Mycobacterium marinum TaxID=1781 RepID=UPI000CD96C70|nr:DUF732 domain-containing protein [Mycobacterium marinum]WOR02972.1 DUF732 domain-containing protein [Mycobacterium marinum]BBC66929.1 hypothetical protein MMRN_38250 [Mycobacterium marinum]